MIIDEWTEINKFIEAAIYVIDFPLLDTMVDTKNIVCKFTSDIVLQEFSLVCLKQKEKYLLNTSIRNTVC